MFCITTNVRWYLILQGYYWRTSDNGGTLVIFRYSASLHWFTQPFHQHVPQYSDCSSLPPSEARSVQLDTLYDTHILTLRHSLNRYVPHLIWKHPCLSIEKSSVFFSFSPFCLLFRRISNVIDRSILKHFHITASRAALACCEIHVTRIVCSKRL